MPTDTNKKQKDTLTADVNADGSMTVTRTSFHEDGSSTTTITTTPPTSFYEAYRSNLFQETPRPEVKSA